jgi:AraC family transcriptional regulator, regulatory protein of adaptative response / DNA-3-methyladenine glycosylase II
VHEDFEACRRAAESRDRRFDGRFVVGVRTTGVYCLPSCPARMPRWENVRFYETADSARSDGLRPCLRCRPGETGSTSARHAVAERALESLCDGATAREVAESLGIGERRLRADLVSTLGVAPAELARRLAAGAELELRLGFRPPLAFDATLAYLGPRALWGVEEVRDGRYRRLVRTPDGAAVVEVEPADEHVVVRLPSRAAPQAPGIAASVRRLFDLDADPRRVGEALGLDPRLGRLVSRTPGLRVTGAFDAFELAVRAILGQQVSVRGATTLARRLVERFGDRVAADGDLTHLFPVPASLAEAPIEAVGMPGARAEAVRGLSRAVRDGLALDSFSNPDALRANLVALPGIGPWTAEYVALRGAGDPDAFPASDLGLRHALGNGRPATAAEVERAALAWRPWRGYAAMHLWHALSEHAA